MINQQLSLIFLFILLVNCTDSKKGNNVEERELQSQSFESDSLSNEKNIISDIPQDVDNKFETFLKYFNDDSIFQVSRINFPLTIQVAEGKNDSVISKIIIPLTDYRKMDFTFDESLSARVNKKYDQKIIVTGEKAIIQIRGIENGIFVDYYFEKKNGKWFLKTWVDGSE